ncbi:hypothetical protein AVL50_03540 [Flammeovirga sp. SJP92]|nr:hypothetical protein AVL50_03540 [Flammeovirga sp. SJP92]
MPVFCALFGCENPYEVNLITFSAKVVSPESGASFFDNEDVTISLAAEDQAMLKNVSFELVHLDDDTQVMEQEAIPEQLAWTYTENIGILPVGSYQINLKVVSAQDYTQEFHSNFKIKEYVELAFEANETELYLKGDFNGWGNNNPLTLVGDHTWEVSGVPLEAGTTYGYKIANSGDWSGNDWGNSVGTNGTLELTTGGAPNASFEVTTSGSYTYTFNDETLEFSLSIIE